jgi:hypothetical protein
MSKRLDPHEQCQHTSPRGQRCRMLRAPGRESFCAHHLRQAAASQPGDETLADELLDSTGDLATPSEVNALLVNVTKLFARKQIDRKDAVAFGYLSQLMLCSLTGIEQNLEAESDALALQEANKDIAKMRAHYLAMRAATKAAKAAKKSQNNSSTGSRDSAGPAPQQPPSSAPASAESATPKPPRDYYSMRT